MEIEKVRAIVSSVDDVKEVYFGESEASSTILLYQMSCDCIIEVDCLTRSVITSLTHPRSGKTRLVRRNVTDTGLAALLRNPRIHTGEGHHHLASGRKRSRSSAELYDSVDSAEEELMQAQINVFRREKERKRREAIRKVQQQQMHLQLLKTRGNTCNWSIDEIPGSMEDVACVAIADGGYIAVFDDGTCRYDGIPDEVIEILRKQHFSNIAYIALGPEGQYYILKKNGRKFVNGPQELQDDLNNARSRAKYVSFGTWDVYYVVFENGIKKWSCGLPYELEDILQDSAEVVIVWLGMQPDGPFGDSPYLVVYGSGVYTCDKLPVEVQQWLDENPTNAKNLRQLLASDGCYFVRFS